jgi:uncharacterized protein (TIGR02266 family)
MSRRAFERIPYAVQVEFRTASSFLVTYSINLSRGGMLLETDHSAELGSLIELEFGVPGAGPIHLVGRVAWRRPAAQGGPAGLGIEFQDMGPEIGKLIDRLVSTYRGVKILILCSQQQLRESLGRLVRAVMSSAELATAADPREAESMLSGALDLAVIDTDAHPDEALRVVRKAKSSIPPVPVLAIATSTEARTRALQAGADEITGNPPPAVEFQTLLVRALGRPMNVR